MDLFGYFGDLVLSKLVSPYNFFIACILFVSGIIYKINKKDIDPLIDQLIHSHQKEITILTIIILFLMIFSTALFFVHENKDAEPPEDRFRVAISPFYLEGSDEADLVTAEAIKNKIGNTAGDRIDAIILDTSPIKNKEDAIQKGRKTGAHLVVYGGDKKAVADTMNTEFYIIPTSSDVVLSESSFFDMRDGKAVVIPTLYTNKSIRIESLKEDVSSAVYTICAFEYYERFDYDSALGTFKCIKGYENEESILFYVAACYYFKDELNESLVYYNKVIELSPQYSEAWNNKGNTLCRLGYYEEAIDAYKEAIELNPQSSLFWNNKGVAFCRLGYCEKAIEAYDKAIELNPQKGLNSQNAYVWYNRGNALYELGRYKEAIEAYNKTIQFNPQYLEAWNNKGNAFYRSSNYKEAIKAYDKAIELNRKLPEGWNNKGNALYYSGNYEEAIEAYNQAIELDPQLLNAWYSRARAYSIMKNKDQAIFNLKRAIELDSSYKEIAGNDNAFRELWADEDFKKLTE